VPYRAGGGDKESERGGQKPDKENNPQKNRTMSVMGDDIQEPEKDQRRVGGHRGEGPEGVKKKKG